MASHSVGGNLTMPPMGLPGTLANSNVRAPLVLPLLGLTGSAALPPIISGSLNLPLLGANITVNNTDAPKSIDGIGNINLPSLTLSSTIFNTDIANDLTITGLITYPSLGISVQVINTDAPKDLTADATFSLPIVSLQSSVNNTDTPLNLTLTGDITFPALELDAVTDNADVGPGSGITGTLVYPSLTVTATATQPSVVTGDITLPSLSLLGAMEIPTPIQGVITLPSLGLFGAVKFIKLNGSIGYPQLGVSGRAAIRQRNFSDQIYTLLHTVVGESEVPYDIGVFAKNQSLQTWAVYLIIQNAQHYDIGLFAKNQNEQLWNVSLAASSSQPYTWSTKTINIQPLYDTFSKRLDQRYSLQANVLNQSEQQYTLTVGEPVAQQIDQSWGDQLQHFIDTPYGDTAALQFQLDSPYNDMSVVRQQMVTSYALLTSVVTHVSQPYTQTVALASQWDNPYDLREFNQMTQSNTHIFDLLDATVIQRDDIPVIIFKGDTFHILSASISLDEGDYAWKASVVLADMGHYTQMAINSPFTLKLGGQDYALVVNSKGLDRTGPAQVTIKLTGISPTIRFSETQATPLTKTWTTAINAQDAAEEVIGESIDWQMINWLIPANRLAVTNAAPLDIVLSIVTAAGGILETRQDGIFRTRPKYQDNLPDWDIVTPSHILTDSADNISVAINLVPTVYFNKFRLLDVFSSSASDRVTFEVDPNDPRQGTLFVSPSPYRLDLTLAHSGDASLAITPLGERVRTIVNEEVTFNSGVGGLNQRANQIISVTWLTQDLGSVTSSINSEILNVSVDVNHGYSLALITYTTKSLDFLVSSPSLDKVQFIVLDD